MADAGARRFYDELAADYDLIYPDWDASIRRQAGALDRLITGALGQGPHTVLDCACGIGTQAIGLAALGHRVIGGDLSPVAAARAGREAAARQQRLPVLAADMGRLPFREAAFEVVVCADNSLAHLLTADAVRTALTAMRRVLCSGGLLILTVRAEQHRQAHAAASPVQRSGEVVTFQLWDWHADGEHYDLQHIQLFPDGDGYRTRVRRATSWAIPHDRLTELVLGAGFRDVARPDSDFFQPVLTARS